MSNAELEHVKLPPKIKKKKVAKTSTTEKPETTTRAKSRTSTEDKVLSFVMGFFLLALGIGMLAGYQFLERGPSKLFNLLAAGGAGAVLSGIGLFLYPLDRERLDAFQNEPNPIAVFKIMPIFWKFWMLLVLAAMIGGFVYVSQTTVRIGR